MVRLTGAALGFFAFAMSIFLGLAAGNPIETTLTRAIQAMFVFFALGLGVGWVAYRIVDEHSVSEHRRMFPEGEPDLSTAGQADAAANSPALK